MKAQLILVGGRAAIPNMLTVKYQQPDVIVQIISTESEKDLPRLELAIKAVHLDYQLELFDPVDAFNFSQIYSVCEQAVRNHPDAEWIFNVTTATTIMSIAAYEVARQHCQSSSIKCWYINTSQTRVISPITEDELHNDTLAQIFHLTVPQYVTGYSRVLSSGDLDDERSYVELNWLPFAQRLGKNPEDATLIKLLMSRTGDDKPAKNKDGVDKSKYYTIKGLSNDVYSLLEEAQRLRLISQLTRNTTSVGFRLSYFQYKFLNGAWLEAYVWHEAKKLDNADECKIDDCQWNHTIRDGKSSNELDVIMTYKSQLIIVECKTGDEAFESVTLYKLDSVANLLGGRFVSKLLVTSLSAPNKAEDHQKFLEQAESRRVVPVTVKDLPQIREILKREALTPTYPRI